MLSKTCAKLRRGSFAAFLLLTIPPAASAQSIVDGRRVEFTPSADHNATDSTTGAALVTNYTLDVFVAGSTSAVSTANLGKPAPAADGMIGLDYISLLTKALTPGVVYESVVSAVGPGGSARSARSNTFAFSTPCSPGISPTSSNLTTASAATGSVAVTAATGCTWTSASNVAWITITAGASGSGNGSVRYSVAANTGTTSRTGTVTIAGHTFTVTQAQPCSFSVSPRSITAPPGGTSGTIALTTSSTCSWSSSSSATWATIAGSRTGSGTATYTIAANTGTNSRSATLTVGGVAIAVSQAAPTAPTRPTAPSNLRIVK